MPFLFQYQQKADPLQQPAAPTVPEQPWLLLDPPVRRRATLHEAETLPSAIGLPYDLPVLDPSPVVVRRVEMRREGFASPTAPLPYDLPLLDPATEVPRRLPRPQSTASPEWGRADVVPDLVAHLLVSPLPKPRPILDSGQPIVPILSAQPFPGDLATTVVAGILPCAIIPSGMTPGDDSDG